MLIHLYHLYNGVRVQVKPQHLKSTTMKIVQARDSEVRQRVKNSIQVLNSQSMLAFIRCAGGKGLLQSWLGAHDIVS